MGFPMGRAKLGPEPTMTTGSQHDLRSYWQEPTLWATTRSAGPTVIGLPVMLTVVHFSLVKSPQNQGGLKRPGGTKAVWDAWDSNPELIS